MNKKLALSLDSNIIDFAHDFAKNTTNLSQNRRGLFYRTEKAKYK
jgi:hypothetical protein